MKNLPTPSRNVRTILIQQQDRAPKVDLALPAILHNPTLLVLWLLILSSVVAGLLLGRVRIPRTAHGLVVTEQTTSATDTLTPVLLLPAWSRAFLQPGKVASVDTGGTQQLTVTIADVDARPLTLASARHLLSAPNASLSTIDTTMVVARLKPCTRCPKLAPGTRYTATAHLGSRPLASFALPGT
jgi:hypothetical protein